MIIHDLLTTTSPKVKETLLRANDTDATRSMLIWAYNKDYMFGVKFSEDEINMSALQPLHPSAKWLLHKLRVRKLTGTAARDAVEAHAEEHGDLIKLICNKDLKCGITATTINKAFPGLIPVFKLQLAKEVPLEALTYPLCAELKYDGVRLAMLFDGTSTVFKTRNGKVIHLPGSSRLVTDKLTTPVMLDMEVTLAGGTTLDRAKVSGIINSARAGTRVDESVLCFNVFDCMDLEDFQSGNCPVTYGARRVHAANILRILSNYDTFGLSAMRVVHSAKEAQELFERHLLDLQEGLILKDFSHKYTFKRSKDWVKVKATLTADLTCIAVEEGQGKYLGMIGALVCEGIIDNKKIKVRVGTGLSDADRFRAPAGYIGQLIEVKYNAISTVGDNHSLFLPRFVAVRTDK